MKTPAIAFVSTAWRAEGFSAGLAGAGGMMAGYAERFQRGHALLDT